MRHGALIGSAVAVVLLGAAGAYLLRGDGTSPGEETSAKAPAVAAGEPAADRITRSPPPISPSFDVVKVGPAGAAVIAGRAEPGAKVIVLDRGKALGEVTADRRGEWVLIPEQPLGPGDLALSLEAANAEGGAPVMSDETVALSIAAAAPAERAGETALAVLLPHDGKGAARVLQVPGSAQSGTPALSMDTVEYDEQGRVVLSGHAAPGAAVRIYLDNEPFATATADAAGMWSATSSRTVRPGRLELRLDQLALDGSVAGRVALPLAQAAAVELAPGHTYVVQRGNNLWQIARHTYGAGVRYTIIYSANLGQIRDPGLIYPGQIIKLPKS